MWNSKTAIGSGGFLGKGYLEGSHKALGFLPVPESDFIFAALVEEVGFVAEWLFSSSLPFHIQLSQSRCVRKGSYGALLGAGLVGMFFFQAFENIAMTMGLMPVTGITLPFLSYGGTSMAASMTGVGLLLSISGRQKL